MITDAVVQYIKDSLTAGKTEDEIIKTLVDAKWPYNDVFSAVAKVKLERSAQATPSVATPVNYQAATEPQQQAKPQSQSAQQNPYTNFPARMPQSATLAQPAANPTDAAQTPSEIQKPQSDLIRIISQTGTDDGPRRPKKPARFLAPGLIVVLLLAMGGVTAAQFTGLIQLPFLGPNPQKLFENGITNIAHIQTLTYEGTISITSEPKDPTTVPMVSQQIEKQNGPTPDLVLNPPAVKLTVKTSGSFDKNISSSTDGEAKLSADFQYADIAGNVDIEFIKKGTTYYVRLNSIKLPDVLTADPTFAAATTAVTGKWIKITPESINQLAQMGISANSMPLPFAAPDNAEQKAMIQQVQTVYQRILRLAVEEKVFAFREDPKKETLGDSSAYHYSIKIQGDKIPNLYKRFITEATSTLGLPGMPITFDQKKYDSLAGKDFQSIVDNFNKNMTWELWVDTAIEFITKGSFAFKVLPVSDSATQYRLTVASTLTNINKPIVVQEPTDSISVMDAMVSIGLMSQTGGSGSSELAKEQRDSTRISDLQTLKSVISLYLADVANPRLCAAKTIYASGKITLPIGTSWGASANMGRTNINGTGWIPVNLQSISSGSPIGSLAVDPLNDGNSGFVYTYACDPATDGFKFSARIESQKYGAGGRSDVVSTDGGNDPNRFEVGSNLKIFGPAQLPQLQTSQSNQNHSDPFGMLSAQQAGRDARRIADLNNMRAILELYYDKCGYYPGPTLPAGTPGSMSLLPGQQCPSADKSIGAHVSPNKGSWIEKDGLAAVLLESGIVPQVPNDPLMPNALSYAYAVNTTHDSYVLRAQLETQNSVLNRDVDGTVYGVDCSDANKMYCVKF